MEYKITDKSRKRAQVVFARNLDRFDCLNRGSIKNAFSCAIVALCIPIEKEEVGADGAYFKANAWVLKGQDYVCSCYQLENKGCDTWHLTHNQGINSYSIGSFICPSFPLPMSKIFQWADAEIVKYEAEAAKHERGPLYQQPPWCIGPGTRLRAKNRDELVIIEANTGFMVVNLTMNGLWPDHRHWWQSINALKETLCTYGIVIDP